MQPPLLPSIQSLTDQAVLSELLDIDVEGVDAAPLLTVGFSSSALTRVIIRSHGRAPTSFVLKRTSLRDDWMASLTGDAVGREARLLQTPALCAVWDIFRCPYIAVAVDSGATGQLLLDLTDDLLPDVREPLTDQQEGALLRALARMHARFWDFAPPGSWLMRPAQYFDLLPPSISASPASLAHLTPPLRDAVPRGWTAALGRLSPDARRLMTMPGIELEQSWTDLPRTLLHGDAKVANFALHDDGRISAFDWAIAGAGPSMIDVGWYIAVNASRLTRSKEDLLLRYRLLLESALGRRLPDSLWRRLEDVAVVAGARMLLWSKALALESQRRGSQEEWQWWVDRLALLTARAGGTP